MTTLTITPEIYKELSKPCPECNGKYWGKYRKQKYCNICQGTGNNLVTIPMEWKECKDCDGDGYNLHLPLKDCNICKCSGKIYPYQEGECLFFWNNGKEVDDASRGFNIKIKILSINREKGEMKVVKVN